MGATCLSVHDCLPRNSTCIAAALMVSIVIVGVLQVGSTDCAARHADMCVSSSVAGDLLAGARVMRGAGTEIMAENTAGTSVLIV